MQPAVPSWRPPVLEPVQPPSVEEVERREIDAWSAAARDLLEARRRQEATPPASIDVVVDDRRFGAPNAEAPRFPSPAEIAARAPHAQPHASDLSGLPPRLRDKIAADIEADEHPKYTALPLLIAASVVALLGVSGVLMQRFGLIDVPVLRGLAGSPAKQTPITPADSAKVETPAVSRPDTIAKVATPPVTAVPVATKPAPVVSPAPPKRDTLSNYGIAVGTFMDETHANSEKDRMSSITGLAGRVLPYRDSGVTMYRLVLGSWTSQSAAENRANQLVQGSQVNEARVLLLGRSAPR